MNYNNYNTPYGQYPYSMYGNNNNANNNFQQPYQNNNMNYANNSMQIQQQNQIQTNQMMFIIVNDYSDVERFIVGANQTINFYDSKNGYVFSKSADSLGKYTIKAFELKEIPINNIGKKNIYQDNNEYITKSDLEAFRNDFETKLNNLYTQLEKTPKNAFKSNNSNSLKKESE